ncbi:hypothetical protein KUTeg_018125 [Tegillarca granosa]|uniref:Uncharacterized protein n=1 Tax=Tegillarca granosa TaxID=220873 RepID=A0ABQ9ELS0_TEGGR|nr:hypothetical protein KUTeg_018125 [Tegillarca granosa]
MQMHIKQEQQDIPPDQPPLSFNPPSVAPTELQNGYPSGVPGIHPGHQIQQQAPGMVQGSQIQQQIYQAAPYGMPNSALQAQVNVGSKQDEPQKEKVKISDNQIDIESVKGKFGWTVLDGVNIPYIFRKDKKFVSVRIVEQKLLSRYPNSYPDELGKHQPLTSFFITDHEAKLLNEINVIHCGSEFGQRDFNSKDLIVLLTDFDDFYNLVKKTFPENESKSPPLQNQTSKIPNNIQQCADDSNEVCGWIQVNNTVTPFVRREMGKFVPLSVMKYAAGLSVPEQGVLPTEDECSLLNSSCKLAGFNFNFSKTTRLISVSDLTRHCNVHITPLPSVNPLQHAVYLDLPSSNASPSEQSKTSALQQQNNIQSQQRNTAQPAGFRGEQSSNNFAQFYGRPPPPYEAFSTGGHMRPPVQGGRGVNKQNQDPHNTLQQNVHPAFVDPRYMFSYNRFPFNMYPMQFGPPNVTVNPQQQNGYGQLNMAPSNFSNNNNLSSQPGSRNPTPGLDNPKNRQSPARSSSVGSNGIAGNLQQQHPSSVNSHMLTTSPRYEVSSNRSQIPGNDNQISPGRNSGYVVPVNPMQNYQTLPHQRIPSGAQQSTTIPNGTFNVRQPGSQQPGNWPFVSQPGGKIPIKPNHMNGTNIVGQNMSQGPGAGQTMPPPPVMSGPHGPGQNNGPNLPVENTGENGKQEVSPIRLATVPANSSHVSSNVASPDNTLTTKSNNPGLVDNIKGEWLVGKSISCMHLDNSQRSGKFCLVEAVCKLYFNGCSVNEFLFALENVLKIPLVTCTDEEEKAFIHYYSLPVTVLKCNKMINFEDLEKYFPQLSYVFRDKTGTSEPHKTLAQTNVTTSPNKNTQNVNVIQNPEGNQSRNNTSTHHPRKRPTIFVGGPPNKVPCRSLEETVQRLRQQTVSGSDSVTFNECCDQIKKTKCLSFNF